jgi:hypothetical protein
VAEKKLSVLRVHEHLSPLADDGNSVGSSE